MGRYYIVFPTEKSSDIDVCLKQWEINFKGKENFLGLFRENILAETDGDVDFKKLLASKNTKLDDIYELIILPLFHEPADIAGEADRCRSSSSRIMAQLTGGSIAGIYFYPIIKYGQRLDDSVPLFPQAHFAFGPKRSNSADYTTSDWMDDVEGFLSLICLCESRGMRFLDLFPSSGANPELMSFASKRFYSAEYLEAESYVKQSLKEWIDRQIGSDGSFRPCLIDIDRETEAMRKTGSDIPEERCRYWVAPLQKHLRFYDSWNFRFLKKNYREIKENKLKKKLSGDLSPAVNEIDALALDEYESILKKFAQREQEAKADFYRDAMDALAGNRTTLNGLFKEIDAKLEKSDEAPSAAETETFTDSVESQADAHNLEGFFGSILGEIKEYLGGSRLKRIIKTYAVFLVGTSILSTTILFLLLKMKFVLRTFVSGNLIAALLLAALYLYYWHYKKRRSIDRNIDELKKRIRLAAASAAKASITGKVSLLFGRYALRKSISLRRNLASLKERLVVIKDCLMEYRVRDCEGNETIIPADLKDKLGKLDWEEIYRDTVDWERNEILRHFLPKIESRTRGILLESGETAPVIIDKNIDRVMKGLLTVPFRDSETTLEVLSPAQIDKTRFRDLSGSVRFLEHDDESAIVILLGRKPIGTQSHG